MSSGPVVSGMLIWMLAPIGVVVLLCLLFWKRK